MNRAVSIVLAPEAVLAVLTALVFAYCARHNSGQGADVDRMEKLVMLLPLLMVPPAFATVFLSGATTWWWLARVIVFTYVFMLVCAGRVITGFGMGAKGQDAAFIMVLAFGTILIAIGASAGGAMVLAEAKPAFARWFGARKFLGSLLTALAAVPIALVLGLVATFAVAIVASVLGAFRR